MSEKNAAKLKLRRSRSRSPAFGNVKSKCLLISNIPFTTTLNGLKFIFKENAGICGKLVFIERNGKFTGNATMEFTTLDDAQKAVDTMHKHEINGRAIVVREETQKDRDRLEINIEAKDTFLLPQSQLKNRLAQLVYAIEKEGPITTSIFVSNLDYSITWQKLKDMFKSAGRVRHVDIKTDVEGKSRGFGTVEFETPEEAILAIHYFNNKIVCNRELRLRIDKSGKPLAGRLDLSKVSDNSNCAVPDNMNPQVKRLFEDLLVASTSSNVKNPQALNALDELLSLAKMFEKPMQPQSNIQSMPFGSNSGIPVMQMRGLNNMFGNNVGSDSFLSSKNYDTSSFNGRGPIVNNKPSVGSNNFVNIPREYPPRISRDEGSRNMGISDNSNNNNTGGFSMATLEEMLFKMKNSGNLDQISLMNVISNVMKRNPEPSLPGSNISFTPQRQSNEFFAGSSSTMLLIKNIPFSYTWKDLQISFSDISGIEQIEILRDNFNRSKGIGLVRFANYGDALRCKNQMDGTLLDGRPIRIDINNSF